MRAVLLLGALLALAVAPATSAATPFELRVPVLMYHNIQCEVPPDRLRNAGLFVCPQRLDAQMAALASLGWTSISSDALAEALHSRTCLPDKTFVITVDDGALNGYENGAPIWEAHGYRASFYIVVGKVGDYHTDPTLTKPHFDWDQARDLIARGHTISNHTWSHASLSRAGAAELQKQVDYAQQVMVAETGVDSRTFVYPYGAVGTSAGYIGARYAMAFTTVGGGVHSTASPNLSPRIRVSRSTTPEQLAYRMSKFARSCP